ncbi:MAG: helix-turn-helix transcriptional regulator [Oscillospiraceae bacterium]|nr:helix-turn-helix transcriptional regulator [Oscillospiraceae bacterium]
MEFYEKLHQLRKQNNLTQEQLAEKLFVSRTAVSKWESGRGYPNLETLKAISKLFSVSIDELLSNDTLLAVAQRENRANMDRLTGFMFGALDVLAVIFLFMPLFGQQENGHIRPVTLLTHTDMSGFLRGVYLIVLVGISLFGGFELVLQLGTRENSLRWSRFCSLVLSAVAVLLFAVSRQPYITVFMFLLFIVKTVLVMQKNKRVGYL